MLFMEAKR